MENMLDLYSDYLLCSTKQTTATGLSSLVDGSVSHDQVTRFLSGNEFDSKSLWKLVKSQIRLYESSEACLIFDDSIIEKLYMDENDLNCWHWDHSKGRNIKRINLLSAFYVSTPAGHEEALRLPIAYQLIKKTVLFTDPKTGQEKPQSPVTKNELMRSMILRQIQNQVLFKYVLADSWFSSNDLTMSKDQSTTLYKKRWSVEEYHKSIKQNASIGSSPAHSVKGQSNHLFAAIFAFVKLEKIKLAENLNQFALKTKIYMAAMKVAMEELKQMKENCAYA